MKKYVFLGLLLISAFTSCNTDDSISNDFFLEVLPIDSVELPEFFVQGETYEISMTYTKPNSCYYFNDFIYEIEGHERTVAVVNTVYSGVNATCTGEPEEVTVHFDFMVTGTDVYLFKFYQGEDNQGEDQYYLVEVPVVDERAISETVVKD